MQINPRLFTVVQRVSLSFNVAASLLQLYSTQWLTPSFTSESIYVTAESCASTHVPSQNFSIPLKPFIMHKFQETTRPGTNSPNARRSLLELGIVLLELWLFRSLESYATEVNMPTGDSFGIRFDLAQSWLNSSAPLMLPFYLDVVTRCVECTFATSTGVPRWDDIVFRRSVCKYVLRPLWKSCLPDFR
ncbi:hypothetical protein BJX66DRAFT_311874 [Aspergillus keveii]|uniref:DUF7580 domain-containing protein n=1 Tax=Aspergillus keveii TaxID=714993 RepID=A0ABR4FUM0_9EURO